jgi:hypothetical protein
MMKKLYLLAGLLSLISSPIMAKVIHFEFEHVSRSIDPQPPAGAFLELHIEAQKGGFILPAHDTGECVMVRGRTCNMTTESTWYAPDPTGVYTINVQCILYWPSKYPKDMQEVTRKIGMNVNGDIKIKAACPMDNGRLLTPALIA